MSIKKHHVALNEKIIESPIWFSTPHTKRRQQIRC